MAQPFEGIRVIDLTHVLAGPFSTYQLAVLGAEVIKVETPGEGDMLRTSGSDPKLRRAGMSATFLAQSANKRSLTLDLKAERGRAVLKRLVAGADVLVENYRAGALEALGLGYEDLAGLNPGLIYCSLTGFGQTGPKGGRTAYDNVIQAASGSMSLSGTPENSPIKTGAAMIDYGTGTTAAFAIASALFQRGRTGTGQRIDCSMLDTMVMFMGNFVVGYLYDGSLPALTGNQDDRIAGYGCYRTGDGLLMLGAYTPAQNQRLWAALERPDMAALCPDYDTMGKNRERLAAALDAILASRTAAAWEQFFNDAGLPAGRVNSLADTLAPDRLGHRGVLHRFDDLDWADGPVTVPVAGFGYGRDGPRVNTPPPRLGADTDAILAELDYRPTDIAALRRDGVV